MDEISPLFQDIEFHERFRGYDPDEVDAYVDRVAKGAALVQGRLTELQERAEAAEARSASVIASETEATLTRTLILAQRTADAALAEAKEEAAYIMAAAESEAQTTLRAAQAEATATTKAADQHASRIMAEVETDKRRILSDAEATAAAAASSERDRLATEIGELEQLRGFLHDDIEILERHLREQRGVLAGSISALTELFDQPDVFQMAPAPATSGIESEAGSASVPLGTGEVETEAILEEFGSVDEVDVDDIAEETEHEDLEDTGIEDTERGEGFEDSGSDDSAPTPPVSAWDEPVFAPSPDPLIDHTEAPVSDSAVAESGEVSSADDLSNDAESPPLIDDESPAPTDALHVSDAVDPTEALSTPAVMDLDVAAPAEPEPAEGPCLLLTAADLDPGESAPTTSPAIDEGRATAPIPVVDEASLFSEPEPIGEISPGADHADPFLDQLREAVAGDEVVDLGDDALSAFFDQDEDDTGQSWFKHRR